MAKEEKDEKLDIDDIKDPEEDIDIQEAISEDDVTKDPEPDKDNIELKKEPEEPTESDSSDILEKTTEEFKPLKIKKAKSKSGLKVFLIALLALLVIAALSMGGLYLWNKNKESKKETSSKTSTEEVKTEEPKEEPEVPKIYYVSSDVGLNLRELPDVKSKVLIIIPYATKIEVLEEKDSWYKTEYDSKQGWVSKDFVSNSNPLVYEDKVFGFKFTFKPSWAGYKFFEAKNVESTVAKTYYVAIPTTDASWDETSSGITKGYASLFVMGVYTKEEWAKVEGSEVKPGKLGESTKYVYTYLPGQAYASDLKTQYSEINTIIKTFEALN